MSAITPPATTALVTVAPAQLPALPIDATLKKLTEVSVQARRAVTVENQSINLARNKFGDVQRRLGTESSFAFVLVGGVFAAFASVIGLGSLGVPALVDVVAGVVAAGLPFGGTIAYEGLQSMRANRVIDAGTKKIAAIESKANEDRAAVLAQTSEDSAGVAGLEDALRKLADSTGTLDGVAGALQKLSEAEQHALAPVVMSQVFTPEGAPISNGVSVPDAAAFYAELVRLGAQESDPYVPAPAKPLDGPSERRFAQQMISFEALLATSLKSRSTFDEVLADLVQSYAKEKLPALQKARGAALVFAMEEACKFRSTLGAKREPIAKAAAIAAAEWTTPLELAGYAVLAERFFDIVSAYGVHTGGYLKRLRDVLESSELSSANIKDAKRLLGDRA